MNTNYRLQKNMSLMSTFSYIWIIRLIFLFWISTFYNPGFAQAAISALYLSPPTGLYSIGDQFLVDVRIDTEGKPINAAEGAISFNPSSVKIVEILKDKSIFNLWTVEPKLSGGNDMVIFAGGGRMEFSGKNGVVFSILFEALKNTNARVDIPSGSILAADGKGSNIVDELRAGIYTIKPKTLIPEVEYIAPENTLKAPKVTSSTHSNTNNWYATSTVELSWENPLGVTGVRIEIDQIEKRIPRILYSTPIQSKKIENLEDGVWFFHIQQRNKYGWGEIAHVPIRIDRERPEHFQIKEISKSEDEGPRNELYFDVFDAMSGIDHYEIQINGKEIERWVDDGGHRFLLPILDPGAHSIIVRAVDKAGNYMVDSLTLSLKGLSTPKITDYPKVLQGGKFLIIKGLTLPNATIKMWLQRRGDTPKTYSTKSDESGNFVLITNDKPQEGFHEIWTEVMDVYGSKSNPSDKLALIVEPPLLIKIGSTTVNLLSVIIPSLALIMLLVIMIWYGWFKVNVFKKEIATEASEAEVALHHEFEMLRGDIKAHADKIYSARLKRPLTEEEEHFVSSFKQHLDKAEKIVEKEIEDIEKVKIKVFRG